MQERDKAFDEALSENRPCPVCVLFTEASVPECRLRLPRSPFLDREEAPKGSRITSALLTIHPECRLTSDRPRNEVWMQTSGKLLVGASAASGYCMQLTATGFRRDHAGSSDFGCAMPRQNLASKFWP